jgi:predicted lipoprotein with Yx(FWY)xxD motif
MTRRFIHILAALALAGCAQFSSMTGGSAGAAPVKAVDGVFVNAAGMTLYTFDKDAAGSGKSVCNGPCAANWPPLAAAADAKGGGDWSIITRDDGARQWAHKGKPLYLWIKDQKPGDRTGDGVNNVWRLARP